MRTSTAPCGVIVALNVIGAMPDRVPMPVITPAIPKPIAAEPAALPAPRPSEDQRALILEKLAQMRVVLYGTVQATRAVKGGTAK